MVWTVMRNLLVVSLCWCGALGEKVELVDKAAMIAVSVMEATTWSVYNTSYIFGVYGHNSLTVPAAGQLVHVRSEGGINHGCSDYNHALPTRDWVALIERGACMFHQKVNRATRQYNASAVIVYNNRPSPRLVMMQSTVRNEVYVFVTQSYGRRLALLVDSGLHVHINITDADVPSSSPSSRFLLFNARHLPPLSIFLAFLTAGYLLLCLGPC